MMSGQVDPTVLQRMVSAKVGAPTEVPVTASRAMRLALTRAAEATVGLQLTVRGVGEETQSLEGMQKALNDDMLLLKLESDDGLVGVIALDQSMIGAVVEVQTTGRVNAKIPEKRRVTRADVMLVDPLLKGFFSQLLETTRGTNLDGWTASVHHTVQYDDVRAIGLSLGHVPYRIIRISADLVAGERQGEIILALPSGAPVAPTDAVQTDQPDWAAQMRATVMESPAALIAMLHRFDLSLRVATSLREGQVLALPGCTVNSVQLVGPDGVRVARAKLGQMAGHVAVRLEDPHAPQLEDLTPHAAIDMGDVPIPDIDMPDIDMAGAEMPDIDMSDGELILSDDET